MRSSVLPAKGDLITLRTRVILTIACGIGAAAGALTYLGSRSLPQALLAAGTATGSSADLIRQFIGPDPDRPNSDHDSHQNDHHGDDGGVAQESA